MISANELLGIYPTPPARAFSVVPVMSRFDGVVVHPSIRTGAAHATAARQHFARQAAEEFDRERPMWESIGQALRAARWDRGRSCPVAAKLIGIGKSSLADYELGRRRVPEDIWQAAHDVLGVDVSAMVRAWAS